MISLIFKLGIEGDLTSYLYVVATGTATTKKEVSHGGFLVVFYLTLRPGSHSGQGLITAGTSSMETSQPLLGPGQATERRFLRRKQLIDQLLTS